MKNAIGIGRRCFAAALLGVPRLAASGSSRLYAAEPLTAPGSFSENIEGPSCDGNGTLFVPNFARDGTIGKISPGDSGDVFAELPDKGIGCGSRYDGRGRVLLADPVNHRILRLSLANAKIDVVLEHREMHQPNDIAVTLGGVIYASDPDWKNDSGRVWRIAVSGRPTIAASGLGSTNGIEFSPDRKKLYVNEFGQRRIQAFDIARDGALHNQRLFFQFGEHGLDGMRCDSKGNLYVTRWGNGSVAKISAAGKLLREIRLPGLQPTNLCFGGPDGCLLYVTEAERRRLVVMRVEHPGAEWLKFKTMKQKKD